MFYYRSANPRTLDALKSFLPVPVEGLTREFDGGDDRRGRLRPHDAGAASMPAPGTSTSATCRSAARQAVLTAILDKAGVSSTTEDS